MLRKPRLVFTFIVLFQILVLAALIISNEVVLANGQEVILQTVPVDPHDIFRGEYVQLRYKISILTNQPVVWSLSTGDTAYVLLEKHGEVWEAIGVSKLTSDRDSWKTFITGKVINESTLQPNIEYGIEQYFVPEGQGLAIQNAQDIKVRVKIDARGKAAIVSLIVDGKDIKFN